MLSAGVGKVQHDSGSSAEAPLICRMIKAGFSAASVMRNASRSVTMLFSPLCSMPHPPPDASLFFCEHEM